MASSYFSHDSNARNDDKIINLRMKYGMEGYGIYFCIIERLREEPSYTAKKDYNAIGFDLHADAEKVRNVVESFGLFAFTDDGECFYSESLNDRMAHMDGKRTKRSEAGKKGAAKRWDSKAVAMPTKPDSNAMAMPPSDDSKAMAMPTETDGNKTKLNKTKENKTKDSLSDGRVHEKSAFNRWQEIWGFPNAVAQQDLAGWVSEFGDELVTWVIDYAARRAVQARAADKYLDRVLTQYREQDIKTVEQAEAEAKAHEQTTKANAPRPQRYGKQARQETTPDWAKPDYQAPDVQTTDDQQEEIQARLAALKQLEEAQDETR